MRQLQFGQHFGLHKKTISLEGIILTEFGYTPQFEVPWHYHETAYFHYHLNGHLDEVGKKKTINCTPGTLLYHHWQDPHRDTNFSEDARVFHVELDKTWFLKHDLDSSPVEGTILFENQFLKPVIQKIYIESGINDKMTRISVDGLLLQAFAEILRKPYKDESGTPEWVKKVKEIIRDEAFESLSLGRIARELNIHPVHLSRKFSKYFQMGIGEYIRSTKLESAVILLRDETLSSAFIAHKCGFSDESHFIRCFKKKYGLTPSKYRKLLNKS